jgi:hypothetical protein
VKSASTNRVHLNTSDAELRLLAVRTDDAGRGAA